MVEAWDKKTDGTKLTGLFVQKRSRGGLDCNRRDKEYIEKIRKKHFPLVPSPNFATIFKRKVSNVSTDKKLKGVRTFVGTFFYFFLSTNYVLLFNDSLLNADPDRGTTKSF